MRVYDKSIDRRVWKSLRLVIVNAQSIADALGTQHEMPPRLAQVVYNGLPDVPYHPNRTTELQIGFVARLDKAKGVLVLLDAFNQLLKKWPDLRLRLVGQGDASAAITARVRVLGIGNRVETTGFAEGDISALLESFRVYAFPSLHEGLPYSILEAMRAGCTIVSTSVGGIPEVMRDAREGLLVSAGDATALAGALGRLLSEPETAARYVRAARERFERNYLLEIFYVATLDAFRNAELLRSEGTADER
jgi:glycosyltransferase involved in cell wall biosynthesis